MEIKIMRKWNSLPLRLFLDEEGVTQNICAEMFSVSQAAISQMCRGERELVVHRHFDEVEDKHLYRLTEVKEIAIGSFPS